MFVIMLIANILFSQNVTIQATLLHNTASKVELKSAYDQKAPVYATLDIKGDAFTLKADIPQTDLYAVVFDGKSQFLMWQSLDKSLHNASQNNISIEKLVDQINESNQYIRHLVEVKSKSDSLNMVLTNNLTRSLSKEELKEVDVQVLKGVVYISLADNMLYKSGSYEINSRAAETLSKIAKIIKDYKDYDVLIEGNTDNVPISKTNIRNNWDLSALRASSVVQALQNDYGVDPKRLTAGGRGEYNPIASNDTEIGKQRNRRTQIIITPKLDEFMDLIGQAPESDK